MGESIVELIMCPLCVVGVTILFVWGVIPAVEQPRR